MTEQLTRLEVPSFGANADVARALWMLEEARQRTKRTVANLSAPTLGWTPPLGGHSIGTLLYHIAATEMEWICVDLLGATASCETWSRG